MIEAQRHNPPARLLIVDDDERVLRVTSRILADAGYEVLQSARGAETLPLVRRERPDVVLLDVRMPDADGLTICREIRSEPALAGTYVMLVSGVRTSPSDEAAGLDALADDYVVRPVGRDELVARVRALLRLQRAETALRLSEQRLRIALAAAQEGPWELDLDAGVLRVDDTSPSLLGYGTVVAKPMDWWIEQVHEADRERLREALAAYERGERTSERLELRIRRADGRMIWAVAHGQLMRSDRRTARTVTGVFRDVTERKRAEQQVDRLARFPSENPNPVLRIGADGTLQYANTASQELLSDLGGSVGDRLPDPWPERAREILQSGEPDEREIAGAGRFWSLSLAPVPQSGYVNVYARDITERQAADELRKDLIVRLRAKNEELEQFVYTVSHDLKSPLITICGFLRHVERSIDAGDPEAARDDMERIDRAAEQMRTLLEELLQLSRVGRRDHPLQPVPLTETANEAVELLDGMISEGEVELRIDPDLPTVHGDRPRLTEMFQNLIENAVKYMGDQPRPRVEIGIREQDGKAVITVRDNGVGIEPHHQKAIFGLFHQLEHDDEGTGIGLAIVRRVAELHGGRVWVESEGRGAGSTFCIALPADSERNEAGSETET